ncbi:stage II sporulation protein P [Paenibacillus protaetiae]|uniref:Stage II sporulation protein P n=1 Tax=Paenibacillus protaetiae TaxID=2509456 RepID=A0A4P6F198_9BACL|nr:stage II sporulation protein P [Paenibacillus protaetiae]QAY68413.1 stage II sporulation protein P [Paenibacillus protaetiae]
MKKRTIITLDLAKQSNKLRQLLATGRTFAVLSFCSMFFFILIGAAGIAQRQASAEPVSSMKGFAASLSSGFFGRMLEMELPAFQTAQQNEGLSGKQVSGLVMRLLTDINPYDPKSMLAVEMPGMKKNTSFLIRRGEGTDVSVGPEDDDDLLPPAPSEQPSDEPSTPSGEPPQQTPEPPPATPAPTPGTSATPSAPPAGSGQEDGKDAVVFIYHTHNQESWYPVVGKDAKSADSPKTNVTLVGERMAEQLDKMGVPTMHSDQNYAATIKDYNYAYSYKYSKKTVQDAMAQDKQLKYIFDIHRDSQGRSLTTTTINGKSYAQVFFIIGHKNENWEENEAFAARLQTELEKDYKGLSRGIWAKSEGNGEYNQSLSPGSVLIEIGGVDNTPEECYRTADALAEVIADIYHEDTDAKKVTGPAS